MPAATLPRATAADSLAVFADVLAPNIARPATGWPLVPFSAGPAFCPGRNLALLLSSAMLAALVREGAPRPLAGARLDPRRPPPAALNNYALRFALGG